MHFRAVHFTGKKYVRTFYKIKAVWQDEVKKKKIKELLILR